MDHEKEYILLKQISCSKVPLRQRDLAEVAGLSLGMTNAVLKKFSEKGLLLIEKINARNVHYILTPKGMEEFNRRSKTYLKKTVKNVVNYRKAMEELADTALAKGFDRVVLIGESELQFILEWACHKKNIDFCRADVALEGWFPVYANDDMIETNLLED